MLGNAQFYNRTIRKVVVAFGSLFNDIILQRYTLDGATKKEVFRVPLSYGSKEKYLTRITSDPNLTKSIATVVPRISFELIGLGYDSSRKQVSTLQNFSYNTADGLKTQYAPIPYNFDFTLSIYVRNHEDGTQILEQILPFFTPDFNVTVNFNSNMTQKYDMPIILNSASPEVDYEGDMLSTRLIIWTLDFTAKGFIYPPVKTSQNIIEQANTNLHIDTISRTSQKVFVDYANGSNYFAEEETIFVEDRIQTAQNRVTNAPKQVRDALTQFYGAELGNGDILAYVLDPEKALSQIKRKVTAAEIGGGAAIAGLGLGKERAEELGMFGVTGEQARTGYQTIAEFLPTATKLGDIYAKQRIRLQCFHFLLYYLQEQHHQQRYFH